MYFLNKVIPGQIYRLLGFADAKVKILAVSTSFCCSHLGLPDGKELVTYETVGEPKQVLTESYESFSTNVFFKSTNTWQKRFLLENTQTETLSTNCVKESFLEYHHNGTRDKKKRKQK